MEQSYEDIQVALQSLQVPGSHRSIISVKHAQDPAHCVSHSILGDCSILHHQQDPMSEHTVDRHVEEYE